MSDFYKVMKHIKYNNLIDSYNNAFVSGVFSMTINKEYTESELFKDFPTLINNYLKYKEIDYTITKTKEEKVDDLTKYLIMMKYKDFGEMFMFELSEKIIECLTDITHMVAITKIIEKVQKNKIKETLLNVRGNLTILMNNIDSFIEKIKESKSKEDVTKLLDSYLKSIYMMFN